MAPGHCEYLTGKKEVPDLRRWKTGALYQVIQHRYSLTPGWMARLGISGQHESEPEGTTKTVDVPVRAMRRQTVWLFVLAPYILV